MSTFRVIAPTKQTLIADLKLRAPFLVRKDEAGEDAFAIAGGKPGDSFAAHFYGDHWTRRPSEADPGAKLSGVGVLVAATGSYAGTLNAVAWPGANGAHFPALAPGEEYIVWFGD